MSSQYKLIVVDDEFYIRKGLESFPWGSFGFHFMGSATNGKNALELLEKDDVDVVITDIRMPVMDGLELSKAIHRKYSNCKIIILTGYEDFGYAKTAIEVGVFEYILKPIDLDELSAVINKLKTVLDEKKEENDRINRYEKRLKESMPYAVENFFKDILHNKLNELDEVEEKMDLLEIRLKKSYYLCVKYKFAYELKAGEFLTEAMAANYLRAELEQYFLSKTMDCFFDMQTDAVTVILNYNCDASLYKEYIEEVLTSSLMELKQKDRYSALKLYTGDVCYSILGLSNAMQDLELLQEKSFYEQTKDALFSWNENPMFTDYIKDYPYDIENELIRSILEGNITSSEYFLSEFFNFIINNHLHIRPQHLKMLANQLLNLLERRLNKSNLSIQEMLEDSQPYNFIIERQNTFTDLKSCILSIISKVTTHINHLNENVKTSSHLAVANAMDYIAEHYHEKISLSQVADYVYLNASYLSIQFKKETGKKFIDYLKEYRMEKAKELLKQTELKVYHVCEMVGYSKQQYFADSFKEYTGMTPLEYRQKYMF